VHYKYHILAAELIEGSSKQNIVQLLFNSGHSVS